MSDDVFILEPTVLYRLDPGRDLAGAVTALTEIGEALLVFRSQADAEAFRRTAGRFPASEGFGAVNLGHEEIADLLAWHGLSVVAMPEPWTGRGRVDLFAGENFLQFLEESVPTEA